ncbi:hypothetical protein [Arthrobacter sp. STN4]|uniref:hypothetical protein n=1 Tax=Arthrobacter sp. STN4 TaxID=2923276 RepID=UPI002119C4B4|nr:hypothetical protein [Arthrobacter sp. STN4]MCQ9164205.1 hypothetical protein [Arthrobacter sp. STN4]
MSKQPGMTVLGLILAAALVALLGLIGARYIFVGSALSLVPWGLAALIIGLFSRTWATALSRSALFGFCLAGTFMLAGYQGTVPVTNHLIPFAIIGLVGALCAITGATFGHLVRTKLRGRP